MSTEPLSVYELGRVIWETSRADGSAISYAGTMIVARAIAARVAAAVAEVERDRGLLLQAMWDARTELGFDTDGNHGFHSTNYKFIARQHVAEAEEVASELEELIDDEEYEQLAQKVLRVEVFADRLANMGTVSIYDSAGELAQILRDLLKGDDDS